MDLGLPGEGKPRNGTSGGVMIVNGVDLGICPTCGCGEPRVVYTDGGTHLARVDCPLCGFRCGGSTCSCCSDVVKEDLS